MYQGLTTTKPQRLFLGATPSDSKRKLSRFEQAHLKAYLSGSENFRFKGKRYIVAQWRPEPAILKSE